MIHLILIVAFILCEILAAIGVHSKINLEALGLAFFGVSLLVT
jgi:hypothetical protein